MKSELGKNITNNTEKHLIKNSLIFDHVKLAKNTTVIDSILMSECVIRENSKIYNCIIHSFCVIPKNCVLKDCVVLPNGLENLVEDSSFVGEVIGSL